MALYTEMTAGDFPLWLAPEQVVVLPITDRHLGWAREVQRRCAGAGLRATADERNEKLGFKIREAELRKVPVMLVVGDQEQASGTVTPRRRHAGGADPAVAIDELVRELATEVGERRSKRATKED